MLFKFYVSELEVSTIATNRTVVASFGKIF